MGVTSLGFRFDLESAIIPVDLQTGSNVGAYISMADCDEVDFVVVKAAGTGGDDMVLTFEQAKTSAGGSVKNLVCCAEYYKKEATLLTSTPKWSEVELTKTATPTATGSGGKQGIYVFPIRASQLDVANGFKYVRVTIADIGTNAQIGAALYIRGGLAVERDPPNLVNANV